jgi:hypothetical protein
MYQDQFYIVLTTINAIQAKNVLKMYLYLCSDVINNPVRYVISFTHFSQNIVRPPSNLGFSKSFFTHIQVCEAHI